MIQRIQTLYLLAVVALGVALIWLPVLQLVTPDGQVYKLTTMLIPLMALVDIFLFKKRLLQARLNIFSVMLCLGYYGVLAIYVWLAKMSLTAEWYINFWASFPLICLVLTLMATRRILKDEALVRAADRIR